MVCVPCIVIPFVLWVFHKYIRPFLIKIWNPFGILGKNEPEKQEKTGPDEKSKTHVEENGVVNKGKVHENGISNGIGNGAVKVGGPSKKDD